MTEVINQGPVTEVINVPALFQEALSLELQGRLDEAERIYRPLLAASPTLIAAMDRLGMVAMARGAYPKALAWFEAALALQPDFAPAGVNAGIVLQQMDRLDEAQAMFAHMAVLSPMFAAAHFMHSQILWQRGNYEQSCEVLDKAMKLAPEFVSGHYDAMYQRLADCDWRGFDAVKKLMTRRIRAGAVITSPMTFMYYSDSVADQTRCALSFTHANHPPRPPVWTGQDRKPGPIRLGYVSADYYNHAVSMVMAGVLEQHDHEAFELFAYSLMPPIDHDIRDRIIPSFDHFVECAHMSDEQTAALIREHDIDILVSLTGYTLNCRPNIFAMRPAPLQVSLLGYPGTLGAPYMDYLIADKRVVPPEDMRFYTEKVVWMPHAYQPTDDKTPIADHTPTRAEEGLPDKGFVFCAYNPTRKISPETFDSWMRILSRTPGSLLWLQHGREAAVTNLRREAQDRGVDPDRLVFARWTEKRADHLARMRLADLYLDTLPYNAHSIASDVMWVGLPVITCPGGAFPGRVCASLVSAAGFDELIVANM
ncbi:MAG: tetratricopeptide repeat protein, partial [Alphaproteobacteria bacterium]